MKPEPPSQSKPTEPDISRVLDFPEKRIGHHRRAYSDTISLPQGINLDRDLLGWSSFSDDDLISMYLHMDSYNFPSLDGEAVVPTQEEEESLKLKNHQTDGSSSSPMNKQLVIDSSSSQRESAPSNTYKKPMSAADLAQLALVDPKRARRIWANRQSAARSKEKKMLYTLDLERKVKILESETAALSAQFMMMQKDVNLKVAENNEMKLHLQNMEKRFELQDALRDALQAEIKHLKQKEEQMIAERSANYCTGGGSRSSSSSLPKLRPPSFGSNPNQERQWYPLNIPNYNFQQLQIKSQQLQEPKKQQASVEDNIRSNSSE